MSKEFLIDEKYEGISPKNFLKKKIDLPYNMIFKYMQNKRLTLNGKKIKNEQKLKKGDVIKIWLDTIPIVDSQEKFKNKSSKNLDIDTIYENDDFLILNKPSGIIVQGAQDNSTSLSLHLEYLRKKQNGEEEYFHVHRLDKETSGVLVCSKHDISRRDLNEVFKLKDMKKVYLCLVVGSLKKKSGKVEVKLDRTPQEVREKVIVSNLGKHSLSFYKVLNEYRLDGATYSLVEVEIKTGITHQIRVHMKYLGHPIVGDKMYGNSFVNKIFHKIINRQFLHAKYLEFNYKNKTFKFEAPLTQDLENTLKFLKK